MHITAVAAQCSMHGAQCGKCGPARASRKAHFEQSRLEECVEAAAVTWSSTRPGVTASACAASINQVLAP